MDYYNDTVKDLTKANHRMASAKEELNREFPQEAEYQSLLKQQAEINATLTVGEDKSSDRNVDNGSESNEDKIAKGVISSSVGTPEPQAPVRRFAMRR